MSLKKYQRIINYIGSETIFFRGYNYYKENKILEYEYNPREHSITALVKGSYDDYEVDINFDRNSGIIIDSYCSCPYYMQHGPCKHIAAVLIYYTDKDEFLTSRKLQDVLIQDKEFFDKPEVFKMEELKGDIATNPNDAAFISPRRESKKKENWRLIFGIENIQEYPYKPPRFIINPYLQYKKLDGTYSRIKKFNPDHLTEELSPEEQLLLSRINSPALYNLAPNLDFIINSKLNTLFLLYRSNFHHITQLLIKKIEISFVINRFIDNDITFLPKLILHTINGKTFSIIMRGENYFVSDKINYGIITKFENTGDAFIFYKQNDTIGAIFFEQLITAARGNKLTYATIEYLTKQISQYLDYISINFDIKKIRVLRPIPKPFFYIDTDNYNSIILNLMFDYNGHEVIYTDEDKEFILYEKIINNELHIYISTIDYETDIFDTLRSQFDILRNYRIDFMNRAIIIELKTDILTFLKKYGNNLIDSGVALKIRNTKHKISKTGGSISVKVKSDIDWFDMNVQYKDSEGNEHPITIDKKLLETGLIKIGTTYTILNKDDIKKIKLMLDEGMTKSGELKVSKYNFNIIEELYKNIKNKEEKDISNAIKLNKQLKNFDKIKDYPPPKNLKTNLREYQKAGYNWLHFLHDYDLNGCLADDMGLGKTVQTLAFLQKLKDDKKLKTSLIIVPVSVVLNWENEINTFTPNLKYIIHIGQNRKKDIKELIKYDIIISSYHTLRNDIKLFNETEFYYIILDESQNIKNSKSLTYKAIKTLKGKHRLTLTGTPIENNTLELWSQINFLNPGLLGTVQHFKKTFAIPIETKKDKHATEKLKKTIFPFILRRKKEDVIKDLPEKNEIILYSELDKKQRSIYDEYKTYFAQNLKEKINKDGINKSTVEILTALLKLRQVALFPALANKKYENVLSGKFEQLKENIDELIQENHKILIFSQFVQALKIISSYLDSINLKYSYLDGSTTSTKRSKIIKEFQKNDELKIFLLSLKAGGVGINLTAADYVFIFDPWWNPAVEMQAIDRAHRIGQKRKVFSFKLIAKETVEEKILKLQERKKNLVKDIITTESSFFKSLSKKDIIDLFE